MFPGCVQNVFYRTRGRLWYREMNSRWQLKKKNQKIKRCFTELLTLIKARMEQDPYVNNNCVILEKQIPLYNNGPATALFGCLVALDGSATQHSVIHSWATFIITKLVKQVAGGGEGGYCLLEVISHNHAVAVAIGGISLPLLLITVCL